MIIYKFFKYLFLHTKYFRILKKIYKNENIINNLSKLFGIELREDWVGRIYGVINPNIQNGVYDPNVQIFEYGENGLTNELYIEKWVMDRLNIASRFIQANNLFDLLTYKIEKIDEYDNYLFIIQPITWDDCKKYSKLFGSVYGLLLMILIIILIIL